MDIAAKEVNLQGAAVKILWKVNYLHPVIASVRIRTLIPALELEHCGYNISIGDHCPTDKEIEQTDVVIINKSFTDIDVQLAKKVKRLAKPLIIDLCDNIFIPGYGGNDKKIVANFRVISEQADCIVTTNERLKEVIREQLSVPKKIEIIADAHDEGRGIEKIYGILIAIIQFFRIKPSKKKYIPLRVMLDSTNNIFLTCLSALYRLLNKTRYRLRVLTTITGEGKLHKDRKVVIWFGNAGDNWGKWGMICIKDITHHLEEVNRKMPLQLVILSRDLGLFKRVTKGLSFPCLFRKWNTLVADKLISQSDVCILPSSKDEFSMTKSANRAVLALSLGVPVVADSIPSLEPFEKVVSLDNWVDGLTRYLSEPAVVENHISAGKVLIKENYSQKKIATEWSSLISVCVTNKSRDYC